MATVLTPNSSSSPTCASPSVLAKSMSTGELVASGKTANSRIIPNYLSTKSLTKRRYLSANTGNVHGLESEDYRKVKCPLPRMFGNEKYAYSLIDIEDPRYVDECARMSKKLIRFYYDQQIIDLEWRKTYKALLKAEHRRATLPENARQSTKDKLDKEVSDTKKYLLELQDQKDTYENCIRDINSRCNTVKRTIKKENDLEDLRHEMSNRVMSRYDQEDDFWGARFNTRSTRNRRQSREWLKDIDDL